MLWDKVNMENDPRLTTPREPASHCSVNMENCIAF